MPRSAMDRSRHKIGAIPAPPPTKTRSVSGASRKVKTPNGPVRLSRSPICTLVSRKWENSPWVDLDDELELPALPGRRVGHRERPGFVRPGNGDVDVLPGEELEVVRVH